MRGTPQNGYGQAPQPPSGALLLRRMAPFYSGVDIRNPDSMPLHLVLAAAAALAGDMETAAAELTESKRLNLDLSVSFITEQVPYQRAEDVERVVAGLKKAGLQKQVS